MINKKDTTVKNSIDFRWTIFLNLCLVKMIIHPEWKVREGADNKFFMVVVINHNGSDISIRGLWLVKMQRWIWFFSKWHKRGANTITVRKIKYFKKIRWVIEFLKILVCDVIFQNQILIGRDDDYHHLILQICITQNQTYLMYRHGHCRVHHQQKHDLLIQICHMKYISQFGSCRIYQNHELFQHLLLPCAKLFLEKVQGLLYISNQMIPVCMKCFFATC